ncbi:MAG TPA: hypothetical protein PLE24_10510 [Chitinispirillaceae bacterium]|jgi:hypothetical protein|nr:hypothetical protein [Chitinispirillaceae bacterium]
MISFSSMSFEALLLSGYILFSSLLNLIALLISAFYHKKFNQSSPKTGFIIAISLAIVFVVVFYSSRSESIFFQVASVFTLLGSGIASSLSILSLFFIMRKISK